MKLPLPLSILPSLSLPHSSIVQFFFTPSFSLSLPSPVSIATTCSGGFEHISAVALLTHSSSDNRGGAAASPVSTSADHSLSFCYSSLYITLSTSLHHSQPHQTKLHLNSIGQPFSFLHLPPTFSSSLSPSSSMPFPASQPSTSHLFYPFWSSAEQN
uniref:Uncharacterized protein n=1 Tax=Nelumbo nucifera TaxID=4432 RepID=A0A822Y3I4_NELNU|nr:TPA_asm: hypothetical protein HUJ06_028021 [Nelumbo nucifera]